MTVMLESQITLKLLTNSMSVLIPRGLKTVLNSLKIDSDWKVNIQQNKLL